MTKTFECFKDVKLLHLNLPIFKKILWGEGIDKMSMEKFYDFILVSISTVLHSKVCIYMIKLLKMTEMETWDNVYTGNTTQWLP